MPNTDRLPDTGIAPSVRSCGDAYDNALAESVIGFYKTEVIQPKGPWRSLEAVEFATLVWVDWFNNRPLGPIGGIPPRSVKRCTTPRPRLPDSPNPVSDGPGTVRL